jgi:hypothetical protein
LKTLAVMLGREMACSGIPPRSVEPDQKHGRIIRRCIWRHEEKRRERERGRLTVKHALEQEGSLNPA